MAKKDACATKEPEIDDVMVSCDIASAATGLQPLIELWRARHENGSLPARSAFSPRDLKPWISAVHVYEVVENQRFTARLLGTAIVNAIGADQTGRTFGEHDQDLLASRAFRILSEVAQDAQPRFSRAPRIAAVKQSWHAAESVWLPLGAGRQVQQILAATILTEIEP